MTEPANPQTPEPDRDYQSTTNARANWILIAAVTVVLAFAAFMLFLTAPAINSGGAPRREACTNNIRNIGLAIITRGSKDDFLPPAYIADEQGRPMHSWRVLILPELGEQELYDQYRFDEPWNGPNNRKLADQMPDVYRCPSGNHDDQTTTDYVAVVGPKTVWPGKDPMVFGDISRADGQTQTLMLVEAVNAAIHWMEPRDLLMSEIPMKINPPNGRGISSNHPGVVSVVFCDGHAKTLSDNLPPDTIRRLLEYNDGEEMKEEF